MNLGSNENDVDVITGEVERIAYEPYKNIEGAIATYEFLGLFGLMMDGDHNDMSGYVQYRFHLSTSSGVPIDSFVVIGVSRGNVEKISRKQLLQNANRKALYIFSAKLLEYINSGLIWKLPSRRIQSSRKRMEAITNLKLLLD